jgi:S-(hydroxymethyl)glutathione dehydrogenase/alcohol dehydrogenase
MGKNCDVVVITVGVLTGELIEQARSITAKGGVVVVTSIAPMSQTSVELNLFMFAMQNQELRGTIFGSESPRVQIPRLLRLHHEGKLHVDDLITQAYSLGEVQQGYDDLESGQNVRGVVRF